MTEADDLAERRLLEDFLLGRLSGPDAERVAAGLADQPHWQALAEQLRLADPLLETVRDEGATSPPVDPPAMVELMARLEKLISVAGAGGSAPPQNAVDTGSWTADPRGHEAASNTNPEEGATTGARPGRGWLRSISPSFDRRASPTSWGACRGFASWKFWAREAWAWCSAPRTCSCAARWP
jgi:hypothetical protein